MKLHGLALIGYLIAVVSCKAIEECQENEPFTCRNTDQWKGAEDVVLTFGMASLTDTQPVPCDQTKTRSHFYEYSPSKSSEMLEVV
ncbi:hypothetical protein DY000_02011882 [Brassica cretica]|uniref:Uncharacterized protein n=1 Tax=Brassica cretica TaxID=69181 RepID=A0ABQ7D5Y3_BRACR|nr:hypothetical protein DY000_02011882 [Brassica cretica]